MGSALTFLSRYHEEGEEFLSQIVTGDETWVSYVNTEQKRQSMEWGHTSSPRKPVKCRQTFSTRKLMATVFWDKKGIILVEFMERGTTINAAVYSDTLKKLRRAIQNRRRGMLTSGIVLLHDNARPHTAARTQDLLNSFGWNIFEHPPYSPDLAPSDFHLFPNMKKWLGSQRFTDDEELKNSVSGWLRAQAADFYAAGIEKLVTRYDKCLNNFGNYVEK
uniref:Tc1-like transposase DDE domain-containing protein n=1 Tax=Homalodisca liturata TaxID=320908 RepID=A0A1B6ITX5_9HEMI